MQIASKLGRRGRASLLVSALGCVGWGSAAAQQPHASTEAYAAQAGAVVFGGDTLFRVPARLGPYSAEDRARSIVARLDALAREPGITAAPLRVGRTESGSDVLVGDRVIMTVTDADAAAAGVSRDSLAALFAARIGGGLRARSEAFSLLALGLGVLWSLLATAALLLTLRFLRNLFGRLYAWIEERQATRLPALRIQKLELISAERIGSAALLFARLARAAITLLLLYFYVPLVLSFFPWTRQLSGELVAYVVGPLRTVVTGVLGYLPNLVFIALIVAATYYALRLVRLVFDALGSETISMPGFYPEWADPTYRIVRFLVVAFALIMVWPYLPNSDSAAFRGVAAFLGLLLTFGSASAISNVVGGVVLIYMRPFRIGDRVRIADTVGDVIEKTLLVTRVRTAKNVDITIPNAMVLASHIVNYSATAAEEGLLLHTTVTIGYDAPWRTVHQALIDAARATPDILAEPEPFVLQTALNDFYVSYELNARCAQPNRMERVYSALHQNIQDRFNEAGIEIMSPHYAALREGNATTIPPEHVPPSYVPPAFRVAPASAAVSAPPAVTIP